MSLKSIILAGGIEAVALGAGAYSGFLRAKGLPVSQSNYDIMFLTTALSMPGGAAVSNLEVKVAGTEVGPIIGAVGGIAVSAFAISAGYAIGYGVGQVL